jgi:regulator of sigma E protease
MDVWAIVGYIVPFVFVLSLVVFFHELGHFMIGRWCGVKVDAFSLGFGPEFFGFDDRHGTHWRLAALPLGYRGAPQVHRIHLIRSDRRAS